LTILITNKSELNWILGDEATQTRTINQGKAKTEILCSKLYPVKLMYNSEFENMNFTLNFQSKVLEEGEFHVHKAGIIIILLSLLR
jgi:hypothetical protein